MCTVIVLSVNLTLYEHWYTATYFYFVVSRLIQKPNCVKVPKEVCVNAKSNPRKVRKTVLNPINSAAAIYGLSTLIHFSSFIYAAFGPFLVHRYTLEDA